VLFQHAFMIELLFVALHVLEEKQEASFRREEQRFTQWVQGKSAVGDLTMMANDIKGLGEDLREARDAVHDAYNWPVLWHKSWFTRRYEGKPPAFFDHWSKEQQAAYHEMLGVGAQLLVRIEQAEQAFNKSWQLTPDYRWVRVA
jgi:hypothetical protein